MNTNKFNLWFKSIVGNKTKEFLISLLFPMRNQYMLFNVTNRAKPNRVNLNYWCESNNLGDTLTPIIVNYMLSLRGINPNKAVSRRKHLYAVGSVLTAGIQDCTVWGSGVLNSTITNRLRGRHLDIRSVRGPFTRVILQDYGYDCPPVYGDPAIFMTEIYKPQDQIKKKYKYGVVMHKDQKYDVTDSDVLMIDICTADYKLFIDQILSVEKVISSSLHGIILAESYGVPAVLLQPKVDILKYYDWYYSTKRYTFPIAQTIEEAKVMTPVDLPNLEPIRKKLKEVFPYDLYE